MGRCQDIGMRVLGKREQAQGDRAGLDALVAIRCAVGLEANE